MPTPDMMDDLYAYNDWANAKVIELCDGLTDEQLDAPRPIGFGTLRATIFHILTAEEVWLERWKSVPWREFPTDPAGLTIAAMGERLQELSQQRRDLIAEGRGSRWAYGVFAESL